MKQLSRSQWVGVSILAALVVFALFEALIYRGDPAQQSLAQAFASPSWQEPLGRDHYGRSNYARLASAVSTSLQMAVVSVVTSAALGLLAGVTAAWKGGWWDKSLSWLVNMLLAMPGLILVLLFGAMVPGSFLILYLAISLMLWVEYFRVVRSRTLSLLRSPEIEASRFYGFGVWYQFKRHLWPELRTDLFTLGCFGAGNAILALASIGFFYVGLKPPAAELGLMMVELFRYYQQAPWVLVQPIVVVFLLVMSFHLLARGK
ncbi:ABC transporter permease [Vibrio fluvialis]